MELGAQYKQESTARPSPGLWADCNWLEMMAKGDILLWDDFLYHLGTDSLGSERYMFLDTNGTVTMQTDQVGGVYRISNDGTDNCGPVLTYGDNIAGLVKFSAGKRLWFEARITPQQIVTQNIFVGLMEEALAKDNGVHSDTDALADVDYVGFTLLSASAAIFAATYNTASGGTSPVEVKAIAATIVAASAVKLGLYFDGERVFWFVDGAPLAATDGVKITATDFPDGEELAPYIAVKNGTTSARSVDVDWVRLACER